MRTALKEFFNEARKEFTELKVIAKSSILEIGSEVKTIPKQMRIDSKYSGLVESYCKAYYIDRETTTNIKKRLFDHLITLPDSLVNDRVYVEAKLKRIMMETLGYLECNC